LAVHESRSVWAELGEGAVDGGECGDVFVGGDNCELWSCLLSSLLWDDGYTDEEQCGLGLYSSGESIVASEGGKSFSCEDNSWGRS